MSLDISKKKINQDKNIGSITHKKFTIISKSVMKKMDNQLKEYMENSFKELDYEDAIQKDKRKILNIILEYIIDNMEIVNIFVKNNIIIPKLMKFSLLLIHFDLYFLVNGLFYNEEYISQLYYSEKTEKYFTFFSRSINRIIYTILVCWATNIYLNLLFPVPNKIKKILNGKKKDKYNLTKKIIDTVNRINNDYIIFLIVGFIIIIFSWIYISCFNYVYPYTKNEWIKSSIIIGIIMQTSQGIFGIFLGFFRFMSIYYKSEKLYKFVKHFD